MRDSFSQLHPILCLVYFMFVIGFSMFIMNPVCLLVSLLCAFFNVLYLDLCKALKLSLAYLLPMAVLVILINPVFNHEGVTILFYLPWGNPLTLESIIYGISAAVMLSSTILWFSCFNSVITSDKLIYLFGRIIPSLSLVISMALRFVPRFSSQLKSVRTAQKSIGRDISDGTLLMRIKHGIKLLSVMISLSLENAIDTADSMKSRGYGLKGRTAFPNYRFDRRDAVMLLIVLLLGLSALLLFIFDAANFRYYPSLKGDLLSAKAIVLYLVYALLMLLPIIINAGEGAKWKYIRSKI